ncbi:MAG: MoxR family ATPase [Alphaproteobacteria bacterium]
MAGQNYIADRSLAVTVFLALRLGRPLFVEGEAGVGKTEIAKVLAAGLNRRLIRLQCYEGLDIAAAAYEWNYPRQMLEIRRAEVTGEAADLAEHLYTERFLIKRPLLQAIEPDLAGPPVLLIDELDRADEAFEAYLLEVLSDFQITIPELGTMRAAAPPIVVLTSNRTREIHDALKRRCLYFWLPYPDAEREREILRVRAPGVGEELSGQVVDFVQALRRRDLFKLPGVAETIDWLEALMALDATELTLENMRDTLGVVLKYEEDVARIGAGEGAEILAEIRGGA